MLDISSMEINYNKNDFLNNSLDNLLFLVLVLTYQRDFFKSKSDPDSVNWTHDQLIYSQSLYQLSYIRVDVTDYINLDTVH